MFNKNRKFGNKSLLLIAGIGLIVLALLIFLAATLSIDLQLTVNGGAEPMRLVYGKDTYQEPGATATANGETVEVQITGAVDMTKLGTYEITYKV